MAKSDWREINPETELSEELRKAYEHSKAQYKIYKEARNAFELIMQETFASGLAEDEELKFGYNFGKLSIAVGEKRERKPRKAAEDKQSLGDWLKQRHADGHGC